jgi:hypothetical protein
MLHESSILLMTIAEANTIIQDASLVKKRACTPFSQSCANRNSALYCGTDWGLALLNPKYIIFRGCQ